MINHKAFKAKVSTFLATACKYVDPVQSTVDQLNALDEEMLELSKAIQENNQIEILDGIADCIFVAVSIDLLITYAKALGDTNISTYTEEFNVKNLVLAKLIANTNVDVSDSNILLLADEAANSNLTKFDTDQSGVEITLNEYRNLNIHVTSIYNSDTQLYCVMSTTDQVDSKGKTYYANKILKSKLNYKAPEFSAFLYLFEV